MGVREASKLLEQMRITTLQMQENGRTLKRLSELESQLCVAKKTNDACIKRITIWEERIDGLEERLNLIEEKIRLFDPEIVAKILLEDAKPKDSNREAETSNGSICNTCQEPCKAAQVRKECSLYTDARVEPKREATHEIVGKKTMQLLDSLDEPKREQWKPKEYCRCVYESDCHGIEMIKSPSGTEWAIGGTNTKDRWIFCPWCGGEIIR